MRFEEDLCKLDFVEINDGWRVTSPAFKDYSYSAQTKKDAMIGFLRAILGTISEAPKDKPKLEDTFKVKVNLYALISVGVSNGVKYGYRRAFKHDEAPSEDVICDRIENEVMNSICEYIQFNEYD